MFFLSVADGVSLIRGTTTIRPSNIGCPREGHRGALRRGGLERSTVRVTDFTLRKLLTPLPSEMNRLTARRDSRPSARIPRLQPAVGPGFRRGAIPPLSSRLHRSVEQIHSGTRVASMT